MYKTSKILSWFDSSPYALCIVNDSADEIVAVNQAAKAVLPGIEHGTSFRKWFQADDVLRVKAFLSKLEVSAGAVSLARCATESAATSIDLNARRLDQNTVVIGIENASREAELQEQLLQAEKLRSVGMLASGIAHDFNNLLTIISGYAQLLQTSPNMTAERDVTALEQVLKASQRAAELTGQLLAFGRKRPVQPAVVNVSQMVEQTMSMLRRLIGAHIDLRVEHDRDCGSIRADVAQVQQVVMNLVVNARDAMPGGGILIIETRNAVLEPLHAIELGVLPGPYVGITVTDTGPGMDEATRARAFEAFFTTKPAGQGTGLGLSTVASVAAQYGGAVELVTEAGQGAAFRVLFPRVDGVANDDSPAAQEQPGGNEQILLAEDDAVLRNMVGNVLERLGYSVLRSGSLGEALEVSARHAGGIDLLITDVVMPGGCGVELAESLLSQRPGMRVLFISGYKAEEGETMPYLQKPFSPPALARKVREVLDATRRRAGTAAAF